MLAHRRQVTVRTLRVARRSTTPPPRAMKKIVVSHRNARDLQPSQHERWKLTRCHPSPLPLCPPHPEEEDDTGDEEDCEEVDETDGEEEDCEEEDDSAGSGDSSE